MEIITKDLFALAHVALNLTFPNSQYWFFIHSSSKYLLNSNYVSGIVLSTGDTIVFVYDTKQNK